jgi:hypothetical protein
MRAAATFTALITAAVLAAHAGATTAPPTVTCDDVILQVKSGRRAGYRVVLGIVSVPPARLAQVVPTNSKPWAYWRKAGLVVRAGRHARNREHSEAVAHARRDHVGRQRQGERTRDRAVSEPLDGVERLRRRLLHPRAA